MLLGTDLATEDAARREDDHRRDFATKLSERLVVQMLRIGSPFLTDPIGLRFRLGTDVGGGGLRGLRRALGDRCRLATRLPKDLLDLLLQLLAFTPCGL